MSKNHTDKEKKFLLQLQETSEQMSRVAYRTVIRRVAEDIFGTETEPVPRNGIYMDVGLG